MSGKSRLETHRSPLVEFTDDHQLRTIGREIATNRNELADHGHVVTVEESIMGAIKRLPKDGGVLWLAEGIHVFYEDVTLSRDNITLRGISPEKTIIKRDRTSTSAMITFGGTDNVIENLSINDTANGIAIKLTGHRSTVRNCVATNCYDFVEVNGANWCEISNNKIVSARNKGVNVTGTVAGCLISGNRFVSAASNSVYLDNSVTSVAVVGNVFDHTSGTISFLATAEGIPGSAVNQVTDSTGGTVRVGLENLNAVQSSNITARSESALPATEFGENEIIQMRVFSNSSGLSLDGGSR